MCGPLQEGGAEAVKGNRLSVEVSSPDLSEPVLCYSLQEHPVVDMQCRRQPLGVLLADGALAVFHV